ncbi:MAG: hypothetical protein HN600_05025 [Bacteroidetes bacterium]|nr:hypothetical protein [Cytophagia bacterium]MBT7825936.1 hypothetical protein [Bacteroidota bacterium]
MILTNVDSAFHATFQHLDDFWIKPNRIEKEIFYEFLIMQSAINLDWPPDLIYDFWTIQNTRLAGHFEIAEYEDRVLKRRDRFQEYQPSYETLVNTNCFRTGSVPIMDTEFEAINEFCGIVFYYVEDIYISSLDAKKHLQLAEKCLDAIALHLVHFAGSEE